MEDDRAIWTGESLEISFSLCKKIFKISIDIVMYYALQYIQRLGNSFEKGIMNMKYKVLESKEIEVEKIEYKHSVAVATIDNKEYVYAHAGSDRFANQVGGSKLLELKGCRLGQEERYIIDYSYKLIEAIEEVIKQGERDNAERYRNK